MFTHKRLSVFRESMAMTVELYRLTAGFPKNESFLMTNQIRKCAVSIPANISEGAARGSAREYIRFLRIALGSLSELDTHLELSLHLGYVDQTRFHEIQRKLAIIAAGLSGLIKYLNRQHLQA